MQRKLKTSHLAKRNLHHQSFETFLPMHKACLAKINAVCEYSAPTFDIKSQSTCYANNLKNLSCAPQTTSLLELFQTFKKYYLECAKYLTRPICFKQLIRFKYFPSRRMNARLANWFYLSALSCVQVSRLEYIGIKIFLFLVAVQGFEPRTRGL